MIPLVPLALSLLVPGQLPLSTEAELPGGEKVELAADQLLYEPSRQVLSARGHTIVRTDRMVLRADEVTYDQAGNQAVAKGNVMFVAGTIAAVADEVSVDIASLEATVQGGLFMQKKNVTPEALLAAKTPAELKELGDTQLTLSGTHLKRISPTELQVDGLAFTPCDCKPTEPSWRVEAKSAEVELGERAVLTWPVVYVYKVPVFALPWLYLPLAERRTGLLVPRPNSSGLNGFSLDQPVFITLGPSYDVTITPGYYVGRSSHLDGIRGPRLQTELRYTPTDATNGRATFGTVYDFKPVRDPVDPSKLGEDRARGLRFEGSMQHTQELGHGFFDRVDVSAVSDGYFVRDLTADVLLRENQYLRSTAVAYHKSSDSYAELAATLRQDLRWGYSLFDTDRGPSGEPIHGPNTLHRLPWLRYALPERHLAGPVFGSVDVEYTRLAPFFGLSGDEGTDSVFNPGASEPDGTQANRMFDPGEREARDRLDLRPRLSAPLSFGNYARVTPYLAYRQDVYLGELTGQLGHRGYPLAGLQLDTELSRRFGKDGAVRHTIAPSVELRWVPAVFGTPPPLAYDEVDAAVPGEGLFQGIAEVSQRLLLRDGAQVKELARLDLGQGFELLGTPRLGETFGRVAVSTAKLSLDAIGRYSIPQRRLTQLSGSFNFDDGRGDGAFLRYDNLVAEGSERLRRGIDTLLAGPALEGARAAQLVGGGRVRFWGIGLRYEAIVQPQKPEGKLAQQIAGVSYGPACDCWRVEVHAIFHPGSWTPDFGGTLTLARFGSFGT